MWLTSALVIIATMLGPGTLGADPEVPTERLLYYNLVETVVTAATNQPSRSGTPCLTVLVQREMESVGR